ncbi:hypothetical protein BATDEDRAFT_26953 [Batrachochytrium dendrobatidis JAM81]|uniref:mRNA export factor GLE1 n=1 Tax=Batrachochytrium dendrobatidis (strain JAM81 / FGSC 10211) TaxID=684364 RepID=F4P8P0_BATDJ|nr:uncharacterized protein BATDEDRAFT_26953 [Batrachochytrium dendrobatidis JAM81]EGF78345.1 hypothetical protein BATDEDRAFT_26953 [Batrachochytrium dendrobatidis JAM81]|eukprot:XP_006681101.1 hypothetical protein BATDEDRAFT_26953 [Batrachochytrium dendrobatidis JAM81]
MGRFGIIDTDSNVSCSATTTLASKTPTSTPNSTAAPNTKSPLHQHAIFNYTKGSVLHHPQAFTPTAIRSTPNSVQSTPNVMNQYTLDYSSKINSESSVKSTKSAPSMTSPLAKYSGHISSVASTPHSKQSPIPSQRFVKSVRILQSLGANNHIDKKNAEIHFTSMTVAKADEHLQAFSQIHEQSKSMNQHEHASLVEELEAQRIRFETLNQAQKQKVQSSISTIKQRNAQLVQNIQDSIQHIRDNEEKEMKQLRDLKSQEEAAKKQQIEAAAIRKAKLERAEAEAEAARADATAKHIAAQKEKIVAAELEQQAVEKQKAQQTQALVENSPHIASDDAWKVAEPYISTVLSIKTKIKPSLMADPTLRNRVFTAKMAITQRIGQLTRSQVKILEIKQAETEVAVKRNMAFPLANVCVILYEKHTKLLDILLGRMMKKCPFIVPRYIRKLQTDSMVAYQKKSGYKEVDGSMETEIQYGERMCGILSLYAAMIQTTTVKNNHGIENGWKWMARILNMKPRRITPLLIHTFLEISGHSLVKTYNRQVLKMVRYIVQILIPMIPVAANASTTRLSLMLNETILRNGSIPVFEGSQLER